MAEILTFDLARLMQFAFSDLPIMILSPGPNRVPKSTSRQPWVTAIGSILDGQVLAASCPSTPLLNSAVEGKYGKALHTQTART